MNDLALKIENVTKEYRLGAIGGTTFREEVNRLINRIKQKFSGNTDKSDKPERFMALNGVSFEVRKGERIGIIGRNGAGKSTLLKLLSRVTGPSGGTIQYNGRISSMLEVGTGFHGELTGRENIYMNGAILGMSKKEIDGKIDQIIEFAEMRQFIDTPVKRYSSGMYVKLAFAVAAHLDNDILVMDEVLAVGDIKFQQKCLGKMDSASKEEGKTVLFVSHNMNLIRQLCSRWIVLDKGKVIFDGDVEKAITLYMDVGIDFSPVLDLSKEKRGSHIEGLSQCIRFKRAELLNTSNLRSNEKLTIKIDWDVFYPEDNIYFRLEIYTMNNPVATTFTSHAVDISSGSCVLEVATDLLVDSIYELRLRASRKVDSLIKDVDLADLPFFNKEEPFVDCADWDKRWWGCVRLPDMRILDSSNL